MQPLMPFKCFPQGYYINNNYNYYATQFLSKKKKKISFYQQKMNNIYQQGMNNIYQQRMNNFYQQRMNNYYTGYYPMPPMYQYPQKNYMVPTNNNYNYYQVPHAPMNQMPYTPQYQNKPSCNNIIIPKQTFLQLDSENYLTDTEDDTDSYE